MDTKYKLVAVFAVVLLVTSAFVSAVMENGSAEETKVDLTKYEEKAFEDFQSAFISDGYEIFEAYVVDSDSKRIDGLGITTYSDKFVNEGKEYVSSGFIPTADSHYVAKDYLNSEIYSLSSIGEDLKLNYVMTYYVDKDVIQYISEGYLFQYGVNENGSYFFDETKLSLSYGERGFTEEVKGIASLDYSLFDNDSGHYLNYVGESALDPKSFEKIDYDQLTSEVEEYLSTQMKNFFEINTDAIESCVNEVAYEYFTKTLSNGKLNGYTYEQISEWHKTVDENSYLRLECDSFAYGNVNEPTLDETERIFYGVLSAATTVFFMVTSAVTAVIPGLQGLSIVCGAIAGATLETCLSIAAGGTPPTVADVIVGTVTGALCSAVNIAGKAAQISQKVVIGITSTINSLGAGVGEFIDTGDWGKSFAKFSENLALSCALSFVGSKIVNKIVSHSASRISVIGDKATWKIFGKLPIASVSIDPAQAQSIICKTIAVYNASVESVIGIFENTLNSIPDIVEKAINSQSVTRLTKGVLERVSSVTIDFTKEAVINDNQYIREICGQIEDGNSVANTVKVSITNINDSIVDYVILILNEDRDTENVAYVVENGGATTEVTSGSNTVTAYTVTEYVGITSNVIDEEGNLDFSKYNGKTNYCVWNSYAGLWTIV